MVIGAQLVDTVVIGPSVVIPLSVGESEIKSTVVVVIAESPVVASSEVTRASVVTASAVVIGPVVI